MESTQTSLVLKSGHFQVSDWLKAWLPHAVTQLSPNLEKYAAEAEWTDCSSPECSEHSAYRVCQPRVIPAWPWPWPFPWQLPRTADCSCPSCWKRALNPPQSKSQTCTCSARNKTGHSLQFVLCKLAQAHLFAGHSLNIFKKHIPRQNTWNANPLYHLDLVPFPQRFTDLSLSIHRPEPVTSTE